jgi:hypothetical protein
LRLRNQADRIFLSIKNYHQRSVSILAQGVLPYKYEPEKKTTGSFVLNQASGGNIVAQTFSFQSAAKFIQFDLKSNWDSNYYTGLSEVQFFDEGPASPAVPEPEIGDVLNILSCFFFLFMLIEYHT